MSKGTTIMRIGIICLLACLSITQVLAGGFSISIGKSHNSRTYGKDTYTTNRPWGNIEPSKPAPVYQPPQQLPGSYYLGAAPATGWYSPQMTSSGTVSGGAPGVEIEISDSILYEQQNIIYTARVVSDGNLASLDPEMPRIEGAAMELIDGPVASTRSNGYSHAPNIVNTFRYKLMPVRSGRIVIPPMRFTGTHAAVGQANRGQDNRFQIAAGSPLVLEVEPADPSVQPWLPLHDLRLQTKLNLDGPAKAGQPVTLTVELNARGALGNQLPSLANQLESPQYRVYRDSTATQNGVSSNGRYLTGSRKETYTLIPLEDGWIHLPNVNVAWWDVDAQTARLAGLPSAENGPVPGVAATGSGAESFFPIYFWMPMVVAMALIAGFWLGAWHRTRPLLQKTGALFSATGRHVAERGRRLGYRLSPVRHLQRLRMAFALLMPKSVRIWMCTRCLASEEDPHAWCREFTSRVCRHLDMSVHAPLTSIAERLILAHPSVEAARLRELAQALDGALYGGRPLDFPAWKRELKQHLRPHLLSRSRSRIRRRSNLLPALNPTTA